MAAAGPTQPKRFRVIRILNEFQIIINGGLNQQVRVNQRFSIVGKSHDYVIDPETGQRLGSLPLDKAVVQVSQVFESFSICVNSKPVRSPFSGIYTSNSPFQPLNVNKKSIQPQIGSEAIPTIDVGDDAIEKF